MFDSNVMVTPLGAGCEVGRSCILFQFRGRNVLFDCGIHPAHSGMMALPLFESIDLSTIDLCLVTHFHLDHCGAVPYLLSKPEFKGRLFMTPPTKSICKILWQDYARVSNAATQRQEKGGDSGESSLFDANIIEKILPRVELIDLHQTKKHFGMSFTAFGAGHVLGACMFLLDIDGYRVLYTGDYSRELDRHVPSAEIPTCTIDVLICESTYGIRIHEPRTNRESRFLRSVSTILERGGKCLLPVFALGRAQEILLILEEHWEANPDMQHVPILYASSLSSKCMRVFSTFMNVCGEEVKKKADDGINAFEFRFVKNIARLSDAQHIIYGNAPCVALASPAMLQSGTSKELFEEWCKDRKNGVILTGYTVWGTLADELKNNPEGLVLPNQTKVKSTFEEISFSAHSDFAQTAHFVDMINASTVILVHGEKNEVMRLKDKLEETRPHLHVYAPEVVTPVKLPGPKVLSVQAVGVLADDVASFETGPETEFEFDAIIAAGIEKTPLVMYPDTIEDFVNVTLTEQNQTLKLEFSHPYELLFKAAQNLFEFVVPLTDSSFQAEEVHASVEEKILSLVWPTNEANDAIADSLSFLAVELMVSPNYRQAIDLEKQILHRKCAHESADLLLLLRTLLSDIALDTIHTSNTDAGLTLSFHAVKWSSSPPSQIPVHIRLPSGEVTSDDPVLAAKVAERVEAALTLQCPLPSVDM